MVNKYFYNGVIVLDQEQDKRLIKFMDYIDILHPFIYSIEKREAHLSITWKYEDIKNIPERCVRAYTTDDIAKEVGIDEDIIASGDVWTIDNNFKFPITRTIPKELRFEVIKRQKWRCNFCNCVLKYSYTSPWEGEVAHIDHIHPFSKRKTYYKGEEKINESSNLQALCPDCNTKKKDKNIN